MLEGTEVSQVLSGVRLAEGSDGAGELATTTEVGRDRCRVPGSSVSPCQRRATELGVEAELPGGGTLDFDRPLPIAQLADVVVTLLEFASGPSEKDVRLRLRQPLTLDDSLTVVVVRTRFEELLEDGRLGLLGLEEEHIIRRASLEQQDEATCTDAADAHHLQRDVDERVAGQEEAARVVERRQVRVDRGATVFLSSHSIAEVDRTATRVGIIRDGCLIAVESLAEIKARTSRTIELDLSGPVEAAVLAGLPGVTDVTVVGSRVSARVRGSADGFLRAALGAAEVRSVRSADADLEDVFLHFYRGEADP